MPENFPKITPLGETKYFFNGITKMQPEDWKYKDSPKRKEGHLQVSDDPLHKIYWHEYGNPDGEPVVVLHGGPGAASNENHAKFFDPKRYRVILFDQRACGKSTPNVAQDYANALSANTTDELIGDIDKLRGALGIEGKMHLFGGSWGSTLAMAYAIKHPENVQDLIMRGLFLGTKKELDYFYQGNAATYAKNAYDGPRGAYQFYPELWKAFVNMIPHEKRGDMVAAYAEIFAKGGEEALEAARRWTEWEKFTAYISLGVPRPEAEDYANPNVAIPFARIENQYFMNGCYLDPAKGRAQNYLMEHMGMLVDHNIPVHLVQGRYDQVCPRTAADEFIGKLRKTAMAKDREDTYTIDYIVTPANHSQLERDNALALTHIMDHLPPMQGKFAARETPKGPVQPTSRGGSWGLPG